MQRQIDSFNILSKNVILESSHYYYSRLLKKNNGSYYSKYINQLTIGAEQYSSSLF